MKNNSKNKTFLFVNSKKLIIAVLDSENQTIYKKEALDKNSMSKINFDFLNGFLNENIFYEIFSSSKQDNFISSESGDVIISFTVDDFTSKVKSSKKKTVLDSALDNDVDAPYSCNGGVCGSCIGKLNKGEVKMLNNTVLSESEIEDGLILACQALAISDELDIDFDDV